MRKRQDQAEVPLIELLDAAGVATPGALVDLLAQRGDAVVVDALGRLAAPLPVAERLREEQAARERLREEEAERVEEERLAKLREYEEQREEDRLRRLEQQALQDRIRRVEQASGVPFWKLESEFTRARTHGYGSGMTYDQKAREDA